MNEKRLSFICSFWGEWHTDAFLQYCLPTLMASQALNEIGERLACVFRFSIEQESYQRVQSSPLWQKFVENHEVDLHLFSNEYTVEDPQTGGVTDEDEKKDYWKIGINHMIRKSMSERSAFVFLHPDSVYSDAVFTLLLKTLEEGKQMLYIPSLRIEESRVEQWEELYAEESTFGAAFAELNPQAQASTVMELLHTFHRHQFVGHEEFTRWPNVLFFQPTEELTVLKMYTDMIAFYSGSEIGNHEVEGVLDWDWDRAAYAKAIDGFGEKSIVTVSDLAEGVVASITPDDHVCCRLFRKYGDWEENPELVEPTPFRQFVSWVSRIDFGVNNQHLFQQTITYKTGEVNRRIEAEAKAKIEALCRFLESAIALQKAGISPYPLLNTDFVDDLGLSLKREALFDSE